jgi:methionyl-tRNA synthetase
MYVWCDALTNYISGLGYFTDQPLKEWWDDACVTHVIGKDIARFHALIWPAMLKHAGVRMPDQLLIHGFLTNEGQKMSKSLGNVVQPIEVLERFHNNPDPIRFYLSHEITVGRDGDFSWERFENLYNSILCNTIGNLLNRVLVLLHKKNNGALASVVPDCGLLGQKEVDDFAVWSEFMQAMNQFKIETAIASAVSLASACNKYIDDQKPWAKEAVDPIETLSQLAEAIRHVSLMLLPFMPNTAYRISTQLNVPYAEQMLTKDFVLTTQMRQWGGIKDWHTVGTPEILFAPLD